MNAHTEDLDDPADSAWNRRPHLLYVAWGFPPCRSGGVYRALATANRFAARGWRVTVISADRDTFLRYTGADTSLEARIDPGVRVVRVPFSWPAREPDLRRWSRLRMQRPGLWAKARAKLDLLNFPEVGYGPWRAAVETAAERVHRTDPVDAVIATANPHVAFTAGYRLHRRHGVPYVADYRDAWLLDVFSGRRLHSPTSRAARWERRIVGSAHEVWFVNDPIRDWHRRLYPDHADRMHTVANGFDPELTSTHQSRREPSTAPLRFGYIGTVSAKVPLAEFADGWRAARERDPRLHDARAVIHGYLGFYATPRPELLELVEAAAASGVTYEGPVGKSDIGAVYNSFDVLLLILGSGGYVTSGKVFEYAATGLPIVSVHDPGNATSQVLHEYPLWFPAASLAPGDIADALARAAAAACEAGADVREQAREFGARFSRARQLDPRIDALTAMAERSRAAR